MRSSRGKWVLAAGLLVGTATMLAVVAMYFLVYVDWRATQHQMMWSKREAHGPWPKDRVGQAVIVSFPGSGNLTTIEKELGSSFSRRNCENRCPTWRCTRRSAADGRPQVNGKSLARPTQKNPAIRYLL